MKKEKKEIAIKKEVTEVAKSAQENPLLAAQIYHQSINKKPHSTWVRTDPINKTEYLPISKLEMLLDEYFFGQWSTSNIQTQVFANEILVSLELTLVHPVTGWVITRLGAASIPIQQDKGAKVTDVEAKKKNALVKNFPAAKAMAFKNACKTLGKMFGRDLNRDDDKKAEFTGVIKDEASKAKQAQG